MEIGEARGGGGLVAELEHGGFFEVLGHADAEEAEEGLATVVCVDWVASAGGGVPGEG